MKLYFSPGACSMSPHIVLQESGLPFTTEKVDLRKKVTATGADYLAINPKGYVPALLLDDGTLLTEGPAIIQYVADQVAGKGLVPLAGTVPRYQLMSWLNFISMEVHRHYSPLFTPAASDEMKAGAIENLKKRFGYLDTVLAKNNYLMGEAYSIADAYLFTVLNWSNFISFDMAPWPALQAFSARVAGRPAVQAALEAEGLLKK
jgi:glutathione S-transferase